MYNHILSIILFTPLVGALVLMFVPGENKNADTLDRQFLRLPGLRCVFAAGALVLGG